MANAGVRGRPIVTGAEPQEWAYLRGYVRWHSVASSLSKRCLAILRCADGLPSKFVAAELGIHKHTVGYWRRSLKDCCDCLLGEACPGCPRAPSTTGQAAAVIERTLRTTRRTGRFTRWLRKLALLCQNVLASLFFKDLFFGSTGTVEAAAEG